MTEVIFHHTMEFLTHVILLKCCKPVRICRRTALSICVTLVYDKLHLKSGKVSCPCSQMERRYEDVVQRESQMYAVVTAGKHSLYFVPHDASFEG